MNITKEKIAEWFMEKRGNYFLNLKGHTDLIYDCIQELDHKWVSVNMPPKENAEVHFVAFGEIFGGEYREGKFFEYALDYDGDIMDYIEINNPEYWIYSPTLPEPPK